MLSVKFLSPLRGSHFLSGSNPGLTPEAFVCRARCGLVEGHLLGTLFVMVILLASFSSVWAQSSDAPFPQTTELQQGPPLTNQEFVQLLYQLPKHPEAKDKLVDDIRKRGIAFPVTDGLRSLVATKSGNDAALQRTLAEADRRRTNPVVASLPPTAEGLELLARTRKATLGATETMPDYLVKQQIIRSRAYGQSKNWAVYDRLSIAVSYRQTAGEDYKLLSVNGMPAAEDQRYGMKLGGTISMGEYVTALSDLFRPDSQAEFNMVDTDTLRGQRTIVYEYEVKKQFSHQTLGWSEGGSLRQQTIAGYRGRVWVDRDKNRVVRLEEISTDIDPGFPITAANTTIDYDWVAINEQEHLLPSRAVVELTSRDRGQTEQTRNEILFRGYRKFGAEVKIIDIDEKDFPPDKPEETEPKKPENAPALKPQPKKPNP
ncbi:MAG: hypothetical protein QOI77_3345 [Blastocatellia bacterium]|nr:hypothetical protein [Blastocatellia bacterium]